MISRIAAWAAQPTPWSWVFFTVFMLTLQSIAIVLVLEREPTIQIEVVPPPIVRPPPPPAGCSFDPCYG